VLVNDKTAIAGELMDRNDSDAVRVGQVYERVPMLRRDGTRWCITARDHTLIRITGVPGGRRTMHSYVKVDPKPMGNGRADHGEHRMTAEQLARHYALRAALPGVNG
jgi:hypothetical protein